MKKCWLWALPVLLTGCANTVEVKNAADFKCGEQIIHADVFSNDFVVQAHNKTSKKFCSLIIVFRLYHQLGLISISPQVDILLEIDNLENIFEGGSR